MGKFVITLYIPEGGTLAYSASSYGFIERSGALTFVTADTNQQIVTTLPFLIRPA